MSPLAEFVGNDALQLFAVQFLDGATGNTDDRIAGFVTRSKRVNAFFVEQIHRRYRCTGGDGHFLDSIQQALSSQITAATDNQFGIEHFCDTGAATGQGKDFVGAASQDNNGYRCPDDQEYTPVNELHELMESDGSGLLNAEVAEDQHDQQICHHNE
jgi:hypothetical protein